MAKRQMQVPTTTTVAGWYKLGPTPGQLGSSLLIGHGDSYTGPGIFVRLRELVDAEALLANGTATDLAVRRDTEYSTSTFLN